MNSKCCLDPCKEESFMIIQCKGNSYIFCDHHFSNHFKECSSIHSTTPIWKELKNDDPNKLTVFIKSELKFIETKRDEFIYEFSEIFGKLNQNLTEILTIINYQEAFYANLLKCIKKNNRIPISLCEGCPENKTIEEYLKNYLNKGFKSQYGEIHSKYKNLLNELTEKPILKPVLDHYENPPMPLFKIYDPPSYGKPINNSNVVYDPVNVMPPYQEYEQYHDEYDVIIFSDNESLKNFFLKICRKDHDLSNNFRMEIYNLTVSLVSGLKAKLIIYDINGQENNKHANSNVYSIANGVIFLYDVAKEDTFYSISAKLPEIKSFCQNDCRNNCKFILIGINSENSRQKKIDSFMGENLARNNNVLFAEILYQDMNSRLKAFEILSIEIYKNKQQQAIAPKAPIKKKVIIKRIVT
ncbi:hypothetical protein SteCoe_24448 [Stentor coeruleus]|uniref:Uncharacterized protein n=1 Tax=Stentor coeruleus TaxID=5963 RepID=A0A1R2BHH4_9CILI|nr:hypothetical protein SteCoe_24448 [Stentor coeruleus]